MRFNVDWEVRGSSTVDIDEAELTTAGFNFNAHLEDSPQQLFLALDEFYGYDLRSELVSDFDERDLPDLIDVMLQSNDGYYVDPYEYFGETEDES